MVTMNILSLLPHELVNINILLFLGLEENLGDACLGRFKTASIIQNRKSKRMIMYVIIKFNVNSSGRNEPALTCKQQKRRKISPKVCKLIIILSTF